jgi:hypothetical protein
MVEFELTFDGGQAEEGLLEFYDAAKALSGFQRSLALTTHLALHGEIITQAPSAKGFQIYVPPFYEGSWKTRAKILLGTAFVVGSVGKDSPVGHVVTSLYDAALSTTMGFEVDYDKTLQELYYENHRDRPVTVEKIDSLCEKIESSIADMHRPIVISESATRANVSRCDYYKRDVGPVFSPLTYEYVKQTLRDDELIIVLGHVSSYNINTYQGRIYSLDERRPIPFELDESTRNKRSVGILTRSQHNNGQNPFSNDSLVKLHCYRMLSAAGKIKRYLVVAVESM